MRRQVASSCALMIGVFAMALASVPARSQVDRFVMPVPAGFSQVAHGTSVPAPVPPPASKASLLSVSLAAQAVADSLGISVRVDGDARVLAAPGVNQLLLFEPDTLSGPSDILLRLPFDLGILISDSTHVHIEHSMIDITVGRNRTFTLTLSAPSHDRLQLIQRSAIDSVSIDMRAQPIDLDIFGLVVRQGGASQSTVDPSHDYTYPVPVNIRTIDGTASKLWQGQWLTLESDSGSQSVNILVLVSEVAKPQGNVRYLFEGEPYYLELLVITETR